MSTEQKLPERKVNYNIDELFKDASEIRSSIGIRCLFWGGTGVGKTYTALTFPGPICVIDTDGGVALNLKYVKDKKVTVVESYETITAPPVTQSGEELEEPFDVDPLINLEKFDAITKKIVEEKKFEGGTIVVDTITDIWSWIGTWLKHKTATQTSKSGNEYMSRFAWGDANNRYDWIMKRLKSLNCNLVLIARSKPIYDSSGNVTAKKQADAQKKTEYYMDFFIEMRKISKEGKIERSAVIEKSRGVDIIDPIVKDLSYAKLKELIDKTH